MKLKTLVSSMVVLGVVSTGAFAAPAKAMKGSTDQAFWQGVVDRNQDNAYMVTGLRPGQMKVTGEVKTDLTYNKKGGVGEVNPPSLSGYDQSKSTTNKKGGVGEVNPPSLSGYDQSKSTTKLSLNTAELYFDYKLNDFASVHVAVDHDYNNVTGSINVNKKEFFFPEAYVTLSRDNLFAKVGRQYLNFGSTSHDSITTPLTQVLSQTDTTAVTVGAYNLSGFYVDGALFNGVKEGDNVTKYTKSTNNVHGYTLEAGYAMKAADYNFNLYVDYLSNMANVAAVNVYTTAVLAGDSVKKIPGVALHGDFTTGPFTVKANYVMATKKFEAVSNTGQTTSAGKPQAYSLEGDYHFMPAQTVTLGFEGTKQAAGIYPFGGSTATYAFQLPKTRLLAAYSYDLAKNVTLQGEFTHDKDYSGSDTNKSWEVGTGKSNNTVTARLKVAF